MAEKKNGIHLLVTIVERGQAKRLGGLYASCGVSCHYQSFGRGTASSELLDILGLGGTERDILLSLASAANVRSLMEQLKQDVPVKVKGIAFSMALSAVTGSLGMALIKGSDMTQKKGEEILEARENSSLILVMVNQGYTDEVMNTARAAGARGGTVIRSRYAGDGEEGLYGFALQEEKEIISIVASRNSRNVIMEAIHKTHGPDTEAGAVICSVALEQMVRLG